MMDKKTFLQALCVSLAATLLLVGFGFFVNNAKVEELIIIGEEEFKEDRLLLYARLGSISAERNSDLFDAAHKRVAMRYADDVLYQLYGEVTLSEKRQISNSARMDILQNEENLNICEALGLSVDEAVALITEAKFNELTVDRFLEKKYNDLRQAYRRDNGGEKPTEEELREYLVNKYLHDIGRIREAKEVNSRKLGNLQKRADEFKRKAETYRINENGGLIFILSGE